MPLFAKDCKLPYLCKKLHMKKFTEYPVIIQRFLAQGPFKDKKHAVTLISRTLGISQTSAYNKLGERCRFSLEEFSLLCQKFRLSADAFLLDTSSPTGHFYCQRLESESSAPSLVSQWTHLAEAWYPKISRRNSAMIVFPQTIPLHHIYSFPQLIYLTLYYHQESLNSNPGKTTEYHPDFFVQHHAVKLTCQQLASSMQNMTCMELIHADMLRGILSMYEELTSTGIICSPAHHLAIQEEVSKLATFYEQITEHKVSTTHGNLYQPFSQVAICQYPGPTDWMIFQSADTIPHCRCHSFTAHAFESKDANLYYTLSRTFQKKWQEATLITGSGAIVRRKFFQQLRTDIQKSFMKAESVLLHPEESLQQLHQVPDSTPGVQAPSHSLSP